MNKAKIYALFFFAAMAVVLSLYLGMVHFSVLKISFENALYNCLASFLIFSVGSLIIAPGLNKDAESFTLRFLLLTTVQMLAVFFIVGIMAFQKIKDVRTIGFNLIAIVCALLFIQSYLLVRIKNISEPK